MADPKVLAVEDCMLPVKQSKIKATATDSAWTVTKGKQVNKKMGTTERPESTHAGEGATATTAEDEATRETSNGSWVKMATIATGLVS